MTIEYCCNKTFKSKPTFLLKHIIYIITNIGYFSSNVVKQRSSGLLPHYLFTYFHILQLQTYTPFTQRQKHCAAATILLPVRQTFKSSLKSPFLIRLSTLCILMRLSYWPREGEHRCRAVSNKPNERVFRAICDGQRRVEALKDILQQPELENKAA